MNGGQRLQSTRGQRDRTRTREGPRTGRRKFDDRPRVRGGRVFEYEGRFRRRERGPEERNLTEPGSDPWDLGRSEGEPPAQPRTLLAPALLALSYAFVGVVVDSIVSGGIVVDGVVFDTTVRRLAAVVTFPALGLLLLLAGYGTARLYADANWTAAGPSPRNPNPRLYIGGGGAVLLTAWFVRQTALEAGTVSLLAVVGAAVVSLALSSIVAGPLYLLQRRRFGAPARAA